MVLGISDRVNCGLIFSQVVVVGEEKFTITEHSSARSSELFLAATRPRREKPIANSLLPQIDAVEYPSFANPRKLQKMASALTIGAGVAVAAFLVCCFQCPIPHSMHISSRLPSLVFNHPYILLAQAEQQARHEPS